KHPCGKHTGKNKVLKIHVPRPLVPQFKADYTGTDEKIDWNLVYFPQAHVIGGMIYNEAVSKMREEKKGEKLIFTIQETVIEDNSKKTKLPKQKAKLPEFTLADF